MGAVAEIISGKFEGRATKVLVADDDSTIRESLGRVLSAEGYDVTPAEDGMQAAKLIVDGEFDVVILDIGMPGMDGLTLLQAMHEEKPELPIILITGQPSARAALGAASGGATGYLTKPVQPKVLLGEVERAMRMGKLSVARRDAREVLSLAKARNDESELEAQFQRALDGLFMVYQPIVRWSDRTVLSYEALMRSAEPSVPHPGVLLELAEKLGRVFDVGRCVRNKVGEPMDAAPEGTQLFVNLHPKDLLDETLYDPASQLSQLAPRVVLEITERANLDKVVDAEQRISKLKEMGYRIAIDDIGAGYSGLTSFAMLEPHLVKLDMALVRDIDSSPLKQKLVRSLTGLCSESGIGVIAEGVETPAERDMLAELGCDLFQGYLFARPSDPFPQVAF